MTDFVSALVAAIVFCPAVIVLNELTEAAIRWRVAPSDLAENGPLQYGAAAVLALMAWRRLGDRGPA